MMRISIFSRKKKGKKRKRKESVSIKFPFALQLLLLVGTVTLVNSIGLTAAASASQANLIRDLYSRSFKEKATLYAQLISKTVENVLGTSETYKYQKRVKKTYTVRVVRRYRRKVEVKQKGIAGLFSKLLGTKRYKTKVIRRRYIKRVSRTEAKWVTPLEMISDMVGEQFKSLMKDERYLVRLELINYENETEGLVPSILNYRVRKGYAKFFSQSYRDEESFSFVENITNIKEPKPLYVYDTQKGKPLFHILYPILYKGQLWGLLKVSFDASGVEKVVKASVRTATLGLVGVAYFIFFRVVFLALYLANLTVRPIKKLVEAVGEIGKGNFEYRVSIRRYDEVGLLAEAINDMAANLERAQREREEKKRMERELEIAREIQRELLPKEIPAWEGYSITAFFESAWQVGGDYYDFVDVSENLKGAIIADVSGKGVPAGIVMSIVRTLFHDNAPGSPSPMGVLKKTNSQLVKGLRKGMFVTTFYAVFDRDGTVTYSSAGHNPIFLFRKDGRVENLKTSGVPLGMAPLLFEQSIKESRVKMEKGDIVLLYTDGLTEAMNTRDEEYGEERVIETVSKAIAEGLSLEEILRRLINSVKRFTSGAPQSDDITVVLIARN